MGFSRVLKTALTAGSIALGLTTARAATIMVTTDITASTTWTADNTYILTTPIYVTNGATLTIQPGTVIRGEGESSPGANDPGTLIIARDSKIKAVGTRLKPIIFTDLNDDNIGGNPGTPPYDNLQNALGLTGRWGGLILLGRTYVANNTSGAPNSAREVQIEGLTAAGGKGLYGNCAADTTAPLCDDDDSGTLSYVSIRYNGFNLSPNNEINGLTLGGVGRGTDIDYVDVLNPKDDGVELFGGTVGIKHIMIFNSGDDSIDYDEGYRGKVQFYFAVQGTPGTDKSDKGAEQDGGNTPDDSQPRSIPTLYNMTEIGLGQKTYTDKLKNTALHFRDNAGGRHYNSFFGDFGGATMCIEGGNSGTSATAANTSGARAIAPYVQDGNFYKGPDSAFELELQNDTFWCFGAGQGPVTGDNTGAANGCDAAKIHYDNGAFTNSTLKNSYLNCAAPLPIRNLTRTAVADPTLPNPITLIDPRPAPGSPLLTTDRKAPVDGFFEPAPYRGAFAPDSCGTWADGWSTPARLGYFPVKPRINITADITTSTTWTADNEYVLTKPIYVTNGATLTIEPCTTVRGEGESSPGANDPGTLIIARDSKIVANGTPDRPIVFTDLNDDNIGGNPGHAPYDNLQNALGLTGRWGGLILLGRTYVANNTSGAPNSAREVQIEGLTAAGGKGLYGNCAADVTAPLCDDDDSGSISFISIRYNGFNLSPNNEINGLTLGGVGRNTDIDFIDVINPKDDGVELFGGTVGIKHIMVFNSGDDSIDYDEGFRGKVQFYFAVQGTPGTDKSDKGAEQDGGNTPDDSQPRSIPTLYNMTEIGLGQKTYTDKLKNTALHFRDNAGGRHYNSFFGDFGGATMCIEGGNSGTSATAANTSGARAIAPYLIDGIYYRGPSSNFELELQNDTFWCFGAGQGPVTGDNTGAANGCDAAKIHYDNGAFTNGTLQNSYMNCGASLPIRTLTRTSVPDATLPDPITSIDPRPYPGSVLLTTSRQAPADGFFAPVQYRGAFSSGTNWAQGWSTESRLGYFTTCGPGNLLALPDEVRNLVFLSKSVMEWAKLTENNETYDVIRSNTPSTFASATCVESKDGDNQASDTTTPGVGAGLFYLVRGENPCGKGTLGQSSSGIERTGVSCP